MSAFLSFQQFPFFSIFFIFITFFDPFLFFLYPVEPLFLNTIVLNNFFFFILITPSHLSSEVMIECRAIWTFLDDLTAPYHVCSTVDTLPCLVIDNFAYAFYLLALFQ